jgi:protein-disulfide isomerase
MKNHSRFVKWRHSLNVLASVMMIAASAVLIWNSWQSRRPAPSRPSALGKTVDTRGIAVKGNADRGVALIEFADFECPFCRKFAQETFPALDKEYFSSGKATFIYRHFPIESLHPHARGLAIRSECAGQQGRFWDYYSRANAVTKFSADVIASLHLELGLDREDFDRCAEASSAQVDADLQLAESLNLRSTPVFLLGRIESGRVRVEQTLSGALPASNFKRALDSLLK